MIRRAFLLVAAAAVALILSPTVAMAYPAAGYHCTVSDSTPASGAPFTVACTGVGANQPITLATSGNPSVANTSNASGAVSFTVTLNVAGTHTLVVSDAGAVLGNLTVTVGDVSAASGTGASGLLARTGAQGPGLAVGGGMLVLVGAGVVLATRRRKSARVTV
jgi:LPXTG-motif cell wall-anchored protein